MKLFLLRHGDAEAGLPDSGRRLSAMGAEQVVNTADKHRIHCADVQILLSSPLQRALETADLFQAHALMACSRQTVDYLLPTTHIKTVAQNLQSINYSCLLMVGHLPMLENLICYLTGDTGARMATASMASLSMDFPMQGLATLDWIHYVD